ncbi:hypothetical protein SAMN04488518_11214 [Pseudovibrio ascidiaceicola]|uniref:Uncharacterized protein n=1 Tax=Pseudovibrio ascidiaceicola TaxID=285279 RepID=A0A1I4DP50_9HYPH|nr:hypothetical protein [Pseudovibrio ascidiaceicola]SFK93731.1 hypothetical protein SAMN04488518_11214 [Pseudovibrio ascidiaceicola]
MTIKHSTKALIAVGVIAIAAYATFSTGMETSQVLTPAGVHSIKIAGSNLGLRIVGDTSGSSDIKLETSDARGCSLTATTSQSEDGLLTIQFERRGSWGIGWCDPAATLRLPKPMNVNVKMDRLAGDFVGRFKEVAIASEKSVIHFDGSVSRFDLAGEIAAVYLKFDADVPKENIRINVDKLVSDINIARGWKHATSILLEIF